MTVATTAITTQVTTTVTGVRREIQDMLDDLVVLAATSAGSPTTLADGINLFEGDDGLAGSHLVAVSGTAGNVGRVVRVEGGTQVIATLGFAPALPFATAIGDGFDLHNLHGAGWTYREILRRINAVLAESFPRVLIERRDAVATVFDRADPYIDVPAGVTHNYKVEFLSLGGDWIEVPPAYRECHTASLEIELRASWRELAHGKSVRLSGYGMHPAVSAETDQIYVNPRWLALEVAARLGAQPSRSREMRAWAAQWTKDAAGMFQNMMTSPKPNTVRFR